MWGLRSPLSAATSADMAGLLSHSRYLQSVAVRSSSTVVLENCSKLSRWQHAPGSPPPFLFGAPASCATVCDPSLLCDSFLVAPAPGAKPFFSRQTASVEQFLFVWRTISLCFLCFRFHNKHSRDRPPQQIRGVRWLQRTSRSRHFRILRPPPKVSGVGRWVYAHPLRRRSARQPRRAGA